MDRDTVRRASYKHQLGFLVPHAVSVSIDKTTAHCAVHDIRSYRRATDVSAFTSNRSISSVIDI